MIVKLLTEHHLEFLSLKGRCTGASASTLAKMPHCWKSHVTAHLIIYFRRPGFYITLHILKLYLALDMAGIANALLKRYLDIDVPQMALTHYYGAK